MTAPDRPIVTVDAVVLTLEDAVLKVLLHRRPNAPFQGAWALPGGYLDPARDETTEAAIRRVLLGKVGSEGLYLEQLATYSGTARDPRGWSLSVAHLALTPRAGLTFTETSAALMPVDDLPPLAFDHTDIVADACARLRGKGAYSSLPAAFLQPLFTLGEMQWAYEIVLGTHLDASSFRRKVLASGLLEETKETRRGGRKRPAALYRLSGGARSTDRTLSQS